MVSPFLKILTASANSASGEDRVAAGAADSAVSARAAVDHIHAPHSARTVRTTLEVAWQVLLGMASSTCS